MFYYFLAVAFALILGACTLLFYFYEKGKIILLLLAILTMMCSYGSFQAMKYTEHSKTIEECEMELLRSEACVLIPVYGEQISQETLEVANPPFGVWVITFAISAAAVILTFLTFTFIVEREPILLIGVVAIIFWMTSIPYSLSSVKYQQLLEKCEHNLKRTENCQAIAIPKSTFDEYKLKYSTSKY